MARMLTGFAAGGSELLMALMTWGFGLRRCRMGMAAAVATCCVAYRMPVRPAPGSEWPTRDCKEQGTQHHAQNVCEAVVEKIKYSNTATSCSTLGRKLRAVHELR
jgi:hypothetical protein